MRRAAVLLALLSPWLQACSEEPATTVRDAPPEVLERIVNQRLYQEGLALLDAGDLEGARAKAATLQARGASDGYELLARAHQAAGEAEQAASALERAVEAHPDDWLLWQFLGSSRADLQEYDAAEEAFTRAARCNGANLDSVTLSRALLASRMGELGVARNLAAPLIVSEDQGLAPRAFSVWIGARVGLGEPAAELTEEVVARIRASDTPHERHLYWVRELSGEVTANGHAWLLSLHGKASPTLKREGILGGYGKAEVVADTPEAAAAMVRRLVSEERFVELDVQESQDLGPRAELPSGVYTLEPFQPYGTGAGR